MLLLVVMLMMYGSSPSEGRRSYGEGCYCHNNGIGMRINGVEIGYGVGVDPISIKAGGSVQLQASTNIVSSVDAVPKQEWRQSESDNAKFTFNPQIVYDNSVQDLSQ